MGEVLKIINGGVHEFLHSPVWVFAGASCLVVLMFLMWLRAPRWAQIIFSIAAAALVFGRCENPDVVPYKVPHPRIVLGFYGFIEGFVVCLLFPLILKQLVKRVPALSGVLGEFLPKETKGGGIQQEKTEGTEGLPGQGKEPEKPKTEEPKKG